MAKAKTFPRCFENHPPLPLGEVGKVIYGGSCINPHVGDLDVLIGFDQGMMVTERYWPWTEGTDVLYYLPDGSAPKNHDSFSKLVEWTAEQIEQGKKVYAGCIGGHGRTGTFFSALVAYMGLSDDPIAYVREHYCPKVVESTAQVKYLEKFWGCPVHASSKAHYNATATKVHYNVTATSAGMTSPKEYVAPLSSSHLSIWGS